MTLEYTGPAVYGIMVDNYLVYIGATDNFEQRRCDHWRNILGTGSESCKNKYKLLRAALNARFNISFVLLTTDNVWVNEKIWIENINPCLNSVFNKGHGKNVTSEEFFRLVTEESTYIS